MTTMLGLSAGFHDAAACLVVDGEVVAAVEQERLTRRKHDPSFPDRAASCCLAIAGLTVRDIDLVVHHEKPIAVIDRHLRSRSRHGPTAFAGLLRETPDVIRHELTVGSTIDRWFHAHGSTAPPIQFVEHHTSHAAAAFYPSPFERAAILTVDGVGEWATTTIGHGVAHRIDIDCELRFPDSLGLLYSAFTGYCGFRVNGGEGELMGLAPFGTPRFVDAIMDQLVTTHADGSFALDQRCFAYAKGRRMTNRRFHRLLGGPPTPRGTEPGQREADLAASVQSVTEQLLLGLARQAHERSGLPDLCLSGGVALNCVANGKLQREGPFDRVWIQPAPGDAGSALGAALWLWHQHLGNPRAVRDGDGMSGAFLGPGFEDEEIRSWLTSEGIEHAQATSDADLNDRVAELLDAGKVVGWFQGRMEFGPRALGHRSILADPRSPTVQQRLNHLVKERAGFRPFAPAILAEHVSEWFEFEGSAPYMNLATTVAGARLVDPAADPSEDDRTDFDARVAQVRSQIPAVTHVDHSARIQTVDAQRNPAFAGLLRAFHRRTGLPMLLNTSFNARDEPIVCTPEDAYRTFRRIGLDVLVLERSLIEATS